MILSFFVNYGIFAAFLVLTLLETGVALLAVLDYDRYGPGIMKYLVPIWEVNGTFIAFYLVNLEVTYPKLMTLIGTIYVAPVMAALIIFMAHNAYLAYSEYIGKKRPEKRYMKVYGVSMLMVAFISVSVLTSSVSGISVDVSSSTINLFAMFINAFNLIYFLGIFLVTTGMTLLFFRVESGVRYLSSLITFAGFAVIWAATAAFEPYIAGNFYSTFYYIVPIMALFVAANYASIRKRIRTSRVLSLLGAYSAVFYYGSLQFPYFFGQKVNSASLLNTGIMMKYANMVTIAGGILLASGMVFLAYYSYMKPEGSSRTETG